MSAAPCVRSTPTGGLPSWRAHLAWFAVFVVGVGYLRPQLYAVDSSLPLLAPGLAIASLWLMTMTRSPQAWRRQAPYCVLFVIGLTTAVIDVLRQEQLGHGLLHGLGTTLSAAITALIWNGPWHRSDGVRRIADVVRLLLAVVTAAVVTVPIGWLLHGVDPAHLTGFVGAWVFQRTTSVFLLALSWHRLTGPRMDALPPPSAVSIVALGAATAAGAIGLMAGPANHVPYVFLVLALGAWAAMQLTVEQSVTYAFAVSAVIVWMGLTEVGIFGGSRYDGTWLARTLPLVLCFSAAALAVDREQRAVLLREVRAARHAAEESSALQVATVSSLREGVVVLDRYGTVSLANNAAQQLLTAARGVEDEPGREDVAHALRRYPAVWESLVSGIVERRVTRTELTVGVGRAERILAVRGYPAWDGVTQRGVIVVQDITAERQHEDELVRFAGVVAHDLRNPLAALDLWTDSLDLELVQSRPGVGRDSLERIREATARMNRFITQLLDDTLSQRRRPPRRTMELQGPTGAVAERGGPSSGGLSCRDTGALEPSELLSPSAEPQLAVARSLGVRDG